MSEMTASSWARISRSGRGKIDVTPRVFCAVTHVTTEHPWTPTAANDFRSAWIPAPPPLSLPAIVRATRIVAAMRGEGKNPAPRDEGGAPSPGDRGSWAYSDI